MSGFPYYVLFNSLVHSPFSTNIISVIQILFYKCHDNVIMKCSFPEMWWSTVGIRIIMGFWSNFKQVFQVVCLPLGQFAYLLVSKWNRCVVLTCSLFCSYFKITYPWPASLEITVCPWKNVPNTCWKCFSLLHWNWHFSSGYTAVNVGPRKWKLPERNEFRKCGCNRSSS